MQIIYSSSTVNHAAKVTSKAFQAFWLQATLDADLARHMRHNRGI